MTASARPTASTGTSARRIPSRRGNTGPVRSITSEFYGWMRPSAAASVLVARAGHAEEHVRPRRHRHPLPRSARRGRRSGLLLLLLLLLVLFLLRLGHR